MPKRAGLLLLAVALILFAYQLGHRLGASASGDRLAEESNGTLVERVDAALDEPDATKRVGDLAALLGAATGEEFDEVVGVFDRRVHLVPPSRSSIELLGEVWARHDPRGAINHLANWPDAQRRFALAAVGRAWAREAPNAAFAWAESLLLADRTTMLDAVHRGWAESGDTDVWKSLGAMPAGVDRESGTTIVMKWIVQNEGFDALFDRIEALPTRFEPGSPRDFKLAAFRSAVGLCAYYEPEKALEFALRYSGTPYDNGLLRRVAIFWAVNDGPSAMEALLALPESQQRNKAVRDGYSKWLRTDGPAAVAWMPEESTSDERYAPITDLYAVSLARRKAEADRPAAMQAALAWAEKIENPKRRRKTQVLLGAMWSKDAPELASAWAAERGLTLEVEHESKQSIIRD